MHAGLTPSDWILRWRHLVPVGRPVLDVACGSGRHLVCLAAHGHPVTGIDRDAQALDMAASHLAGQGELVQADIENGPWPLADRQFGAVVVTNYLWRALLPTLVASVEPGGVLLYETFAAGNETVGKPSRPDFLLRPGELLAACSGLRVVAYEDGSVSGPDRFIQRVAALRETNGDRPARYPLSLES